MKINFIHKINKNKIGQNIFIMSLSISGILLITSGAVLNKLDIKKPQNRIKIKIIEKQVAKKKSNIPTLKELSIDLNTPVSVNVSDYIENLNDIDKFVLNKFKLDTSLVNVNESGNYTYTISYKDKKYNGIIIVKQKETEMPTISNITLKSLNLEIDSNLSQNINDYIVETIPEETKNSILINLNNVNTKVAGTYQYTVTYNEKLYTGNITIYESQQQIITPSAENKKENITNDTDTGNTTEKDQSNPQ